MSSKHQTILTRDSLNGPKNWQQRAGIRLKDVGSIVLHYVITADVLTKMHFSLKRCTDYLQVI